MGGRNVPFAVRVQIAREQLNGADEKLIRPHCLEASIPTTDRHTDEGVAGVRAAGRQIRNSVRVEIARDYRHGTVGEQAWRLIEEPVPSAEQDPDRVESHDRRVQPAVSVEVRQRRGDRNGRHRREQVREQGAGRAGVFLSGVGNPWAVVAGVGQAVPIAVPLVRIEHGRAVVDGAAHAVPVGVVERIGGTGVAGVPQPVPIDVLLARVRRGRAVVARISPAVMVSIDLGDIEAIGTIVDGAHIGESRRSEPIVVRVGAGIAGVSRAVMVGVFLSRVGLRGAVVAGVSQAVAVRVGLRRVEDCRAVIRRTGVRGESRVTQAVPVPVRALV